MTGLLLLVTLALAQEDRGAAGLGAQVVGWQGSARHYVQPAVTGWVSLGSGTFVPTVEAMATRRQDVGGVYSYATWSGRLSAVLSWTAGTRATRFHAGLGPALSARVGTLSSEDVPGQRRIASVQGGVRVRLGLHGPIGARLLGTWHVAATTRERSVDYDTGLGLGVRW